MNSYIYFALGVVCFAVYSYMLWIMFVDRPEWMKKWNWKSGLFLLNTLALFFMSFACFSVMKN